MAAGEWDVSLSFNGSRGGGMKADADAERAQVKKEVPDRPERGSESSLC
jgi:hypothetical protein